MPETKKEDVKKSYKKLKLNSRQEQLLHDLGFLKKITRAEYAKRFGVSVPTAARDLKSLLKKGLLSAYGPLGPGRWYELKKES